MRRNAVFLDLNGTLVRPLEQERLADLYPIAAAVAARLTQAAFVCPVITVPSRIAKGFVTHQQFVDWFSTFAERKRR